MGESDFNQFMQLRIQLVLVVKHYSTEEKLSLVLILTLSKNTDEQLKLAQKLVDLVDRPYTKNFETLLRCNVDQPESSYAQLRLFTRKK